MKKKRVETFRNIRYVASPDRNIIIYIQKNRASCTTRLARSRSPIMYCRTDMHIRTERVN